MRKSILILICILNGFRCFGQDADIKPLKILKGHPFKINFLDFNSDGNYLASCGWDNTIRIWDMNDFSEINVLKSHSDAIWTSVISNDDKYLASGSLDASFIIWDFKSGDLIQKVNNFPLTTRTFLDKSDAPIINLPNYVYGLTFYNNNQNLAVGFAEGKIRMYEMDSLKLLRILEGHNSTVISIIFSKNEEIMISSAIGKEIIIWDTKTYKPLHIIKGKNAYICQFLKDEKYFMSAGNCIVEIYEISTWNKIRSLPVQCGLQNAQIFSNERYLATCGEDHTARLYNFETGEEIWRYTNPKPEVGFCSICPNEKYFVVGLPEGDILIWKLNELIKNE